MKRFNGLLRDIVNEGLVPPSKRRFPTKKEKEQIEILVVELLGELYQSAAKAGDLDEFKLTSSDKLNIHGEISKSLSPEVDATNKKMIDDMIKEFEWTVNNGGKVKALIEDTGVLEI